MENEKQKSEKDKNFVVVLGEGECPFKPREDPGGLWKRTLEHFGVKFLEGGELDEFLEKIVVEK